ncbi:acyl-CoA carboxylase subunit epsilon [Streptomyces sp. RKND-216]|uniref:acyl-CoA carboxylase epsilon subunit n=1 Tax=Streptomyces sp. RKND-216 TaxID=2562581 RepID=UPI00109DB514|nr:acyl-CoA carboxylase epsilon subunit [Streptomyces sp. RKND-216]THA24327.1 acyl-CoA carboxylase subunit epsilon [Streptomyces sp. RKND-216]
MSTAGTRLVRVEKGHASDEELAAVTALLLARATAAPLRAAAGHSAAAARGAAGKAGWRRLERTPGFRAPHSWRH